jgi:hypothetical protein
MPSGLDTFLRMAGLFGPQDDTDAYMGMPPELPVQRGGAPPLINRQGPGISVPGAYGDEGIVPDEEVFAEVEQPMSTLEAFRQNVLNPPKRTRMTYPKNTLAGLSEALKIAAEPSPLAKNRVWVNGVPHQKQQVRTDPVTGEKQFITNVHEPAFMDQVMRAMPAAISPAIDILNQPREDAIADWEMQNKAFKEAAGAESAMALAQQRQAQAQAIPQKTAQGERALDIKQMDAETRRRLADLKDLSESDKLALVQAGKVSLEELRAANQYTLQELRGEQRTGQIAQQGNIRSGQIEQQGRIRSGQIAQQGQITSGHIAQRGSIAEDLAAVRGEQARQTKAAPGTPNTTSSTHTQQKQAAINKANEVINAHPEWADKITKDPTTGMPTIVPPGDPWFGEPDYSEYDKIYEALYGRKRTGGAAAPINTPTTTTPPKAPTSAAATTTKAPTPTKNTTRPPTAPSTTPKKETGSVRVQAPNGQTGTWDLSKGPVPKDFKRIQ